MWKFLPIVMAVGILFWPDKPQKPIVQANEELAVGTDAAALLEGASEPQVTATAAACISIEQPAKPEETKPRAPLEPVTETVATTHGSGEASNGVTVLSIDYGHNPKQVLEALVEGGALLYRLGSNNRPQKTWDVYNQEWRVVTQLKPITGEVRNVTKEASVLPSAGPSILIIPKLLWTQLSSKAKGNTNLALQYVRSPFGIEVKTTAAGIKPVRHSVTL